VPLDNEKMIRHMTSLLPVMIQEQTIFLEKNIEEGQKLGLFSSELGTKYRRKEEKPSK
jgi:hypothetical protein